jgi:hypothetical protein
VTKVNPIRIDRSQTHPRMVVVACSPVLARVPSVRNFDSIIPRFFDHTLDIGVKENNGVTLSKS